MKPKKFIFLISVVCLLLSHLPIHSQVDPLGKLKQYDIVSIDQMVSGQKSSLQEFQNIDLGDYGNYELDLLESQLISNNYIRRTETDKGIIRSTQLPSIRTFIGHIKGKPESMVALTVNDNFVHGFIKVADSEINIEPLRYYDQNAAEDAVMIYKSSDQKHLTKSHCGIDATLEQQFRESVENQKETKALEGCIEVDMAVASDYSMLAYYGSIEDVENHAVAILNAVQTNYDTEFDSEIKFNLVEQFISTCTTCDPWTSSVDSETLLLDYREWTETGWENTVDQSSLWSKRDYERAGNSAANGLAWINTVCTTHSSMVVEDNDTGERKRVLFAHELGHNFGASHDDPGTNFIMSTPLAETNEWSTESKESINRRTLRFTCLTSCERSQNVVADFSQEFIGQCIPVNVQFRNNSIGDIDSVKWQFPGGNPIYSEELEPVVNYGVGGTFAVRLEIFGSNGTTDILERRDLITFGQTPQTSFSYDMVGDNLVIFSIDNQLDNTDYTWDFGDGATSTELSPSHVFSQINGSIVTLSAVNNCGTSYTEKILSETVAVPPVADFTSTETLLCEGESVQFVNLSENSDSVSWFFQGAAPFNTSIENPVVIYPEAGSYSVGLIAINSAGADSIALTSYSLVDPEPVSSFVYQLTEKTVTFTQTSEFVRSILWDFGDGTTSDEIHPVHSYTDEGEYEVSLMIENYCNTVISTETILIAGEKPVAKFETSSVQQCLGGSILFSDISDNALSHEWTFEGGNPSTSTDANPIVAYMNEGVFSVTLKVTNTNGVDEIVKEDLVKIEGDPFTRFEYIKEGNEVTFINNSSNFENSLWDFGDGSLSGLENPVYSYAESGSYEVSLTTTNSCGSNTHVRTVAIDIDLPVATLDVNTTSICAGSVASFSNTSQNANSIQWIFDGGIPRTSSSANPSVLYISTGQYDVTLIAENENGSDTIQFSEYISVSNQPRALFESNVSDQNVSFQNLSENGTDYFWNFGDGAFSTEETPSYSYTESGSYTVSLRVTNGCGNSEISRTVIIENMSNGVNQDTTEIITDFTLSDSEVCPRQSIQITNLSTAIDSTIVVINDTIVIDSNEFSLNEPGDYLISMIVYRNGQSEQVDKIITVLNSPIGAFSFQRIGDSNDIQFINESENANSFIWSFSDGFSSAFASPIHSFAEEIPYEVQLIASNSCSSTAVSEMVDLSIKDKPNALMTASLQQICKGQTVTFDVIDSLARDVEWLFEGGNISSSSDRSVTVQYDEIGRFDVQLITSNFNGSDTSNMPEIITVSDAPAIDISSSALDLEAQFEATNVSGASYLWNFGDGNSSTLINPNHTYDNLGSYLVTLTVELPCGQITLTEEITVEANVVLPVARLSLTNEIVNTGGRIRFSSVSENTDRVEWFFEGGDIETSEEEQLIVQYDEDGVFDVILIAFNEYGSDTLIREDRITVTSLGLQSSAESRELYSEKSKIETIISPNPFMDRFTIELETEQLGEAKILMFNSSGALVQEEQFVLSSKQFRYTVDAADLVSGMYIVRIIVGDDMIQQKIIKL